VPTVPAPGDADVIESGAVAASIVIETAVDWLALA
jgi:hypothetical protein